MRSCSIPVRRTVAATERAYGHWAWLRGSSLGVVGSSLASLSRDLGQARCPRRYPRLSVGPGRNLLLESKVPPMTRDSLRVPNGPGRNDTREAANGKAFARRRPVPGPRGKGECSVREGAMVTLAANAVRTKGVDRRRRISGRIKSALEPARFNDSWPIGSQVLAGPPVSWLDKAFRRPASPVVVAVFFRNTAPKPATDAGMQLEDERRIYT